MHVNQLAWLEQEAGVGDDFADARQEDAEKRLLF